MKEKVFNISGMSCTSCAARIEATLDEHPGVKDATIDFEQKTLDITYDEAVITDEDIKNTIKTIGYEATEEGR